MKIYQVKLYENGNFSRVARLDELPHELLARMAASTGGWLGKGGTMSTPEGCIEQARIILSLREQGAPI